MKYYVTSGLITEVVTASSPIGAAISACNKHGDLSLFAESMRISERGHDIHSDDTIIATSYAENNGEEFYRKLDELG